jgi:hypothetical protein
VFKTRGLFTFPQVQMAREAERERQLAALTSDQAGGTITVRADRGEVREVRRRDFGSLVGLGAAAVVAERLVAAVNPDLATALDVTSHSRSSTLAPDTVEQLAGMVDRFLLTYRSSDVASLHRDLLTTRVHVDGLLDRRLTLEQHRELLVLAGWLSALLGLACFDLGKHAAVTAWCEDAIELAKQAGHSELAAWAHEPLVIRAFYLDQAGEAVRHAQAGLALAPAGSAAAARLAAQEMRALARAGRPEEYEQARKRAEQVASTLPLVDDGGYTFRAMPRNTLPFFTASSLVALGRNREAATLAGELSTRSGRGLHRLEHALALAGLGQLDGAATEGMAALRAPRMVVSVAARAGDLDRTLTARAPELPEVRDFHERYLTVRCSLAGQKAIPPADRRPATAP